MSKTNKGRKDGTKNNKSKKDVGNNRKKEKTVVATVVADAEEAKAEVQGPKPDYSSKKHICAILDKVSAHHCTDINQLLNGIHDKDVYRIGDVELAKDHFPIYKGSQDDELVIVAENVPTSHRLALAGCGSGTRVPYAKVMKPTFVCGIKNDDVRKAVYALWKFLRNNAGLQIDDDVGQGMGRKIYTEVKQAPEPEEIERDCFKVARILWTGSQLGLVEVEGNILEIKDAPTVSGSTRAIFIKEATVESGLLDAELERGKKTYLKVGQLRNNDFQSTLSEPSSKIQMGIYHLVRKLLKKEGLILPQKATSAKVAFAPAIKQQTPAVIDQSIPSIRPLKDMVAEMPGYYDLSDNKKLIVVTTKVKGIRQLKVTEIDEGHKLSQFGVKRGHSLPTQLVVSGGRKNDTQATKEFIQYIRTILIANGVVKSFKGGENHPRNDGLKRHQLNCPQFGKATLHVRFDTKNRFEQSNV